MGGMGGMWLGGRGMVMGFEWIFGVLQKVTF